MSLQPTMIRSEIQAFGSLTTNQLMRIYKEGCEPRLFLNQLTVKAIIQKIKNLISARKPITKYMVETFYQRK